MTTSSWNLLNSQNIIAGVHGVGDYYFDFIPNENVYAVSTDADDSDTLFIDVNNDYIMDFQINAICDAFGFWHHFEYCSITPLNGNMLSAAPYDSCFANCPVDSFLFTIPMVEPISLNDTIDNYNTWIDSSAYLNLGGYDCCIPNGCGYGCNHANFSNQQKYIGIKVNAAGGLYFGWIKINQVVNDSMIVDDFACNYFAIGLESYNTGLDFSIYPNPASSETTVQFNKSVNHAILTVYDISGQLVKQISNISSTSLKLTCDNLSNGIYFIKLTQSGSTHFAAKTMIVNK